MSPYLMCRIFAARKSISAHAIPTSAGDELVWRHVTQQVPSRGARQSRRSYAPLLGPNEEDCVVSSVNVTTPNQAIFEGKKPVAKMTKAEVYPSYFDTLYD